MSAAATVLAALAFLVGLVIGPALLRRVGGAFAGRRPRMWAVRAATATCVSESCVIVSARTAEEATRAVRDSVGPSLVFMRAADDLVATPATQEELESQ